MKIGEIGKKTGLSASNIRFYEKKGLLCPKRRQESQYREYEEEEVRRLKEIMLLRRLGISVESIYLMYEGQAEYGELLKRQEIELKEQVEMLMGSLELCRILKEKEPLQELDVDQWLNYIHTEEENGKKFAAVGEILEDLAEYSKLASFRYDPYMGRFFRKKGVVTTLVLLVILALLMAAVSSVLAGGGVLGRSVIGFWMLYFLGLGLGFFWFRRGRKREEEEER